MSAALLRNMFQQMTQVFLKNVLALAFDIDETSSVMKARPVVKGLLVRHF